MSSLPTGAPRPSPPRCSGGLQGLPRGEIGQFARLRDPHRACRSRTARWASRIVPDATATASCTVFTNLQLPERGFAVLEPRIVDDLRPARRIVPSGQRIRVVGVEGGPQFGVV